MRIKLIILPLLFLSGIFYAQKTPVTDSISRKKLQAIKNDQTIKIDGILDDEVWKNVPIASNF